jgi:hypothetical protein
MKFSSFCAAIIVFPTISAGQDVSVLSQVEQTFLSCKQAGQLDDARLICYDKAAEQLPNETKLSNSEPEVATADAEPEDTGAWRVSRSTNPIDDTPSVTLFLEASSGKSKWDDKVMLIARCRSNETDVYINWHDYLGDDSRSVYEEWKRVTVRIGSDKAEEQRWSISTDNEATFAPSWSGDLLKKMINEDQAIFSVTPYGESPVIAIFDTHGLRDALKPLAETCNWTF